MRHHPSHRSPGSSGRPLRRFPLSTLWAILVLLTLSAGNGIGAESSEPLELEWDALIPADYQPEKIMNQYGDISELDDSDPRAQKIMDQLQELWSKAPIVTALDGRRVKLPGFVVPLEGDGIKLREFFLVPYYGACIHVPPPPANQIVYVKVPQEQTKIRNAFDTVWVTGTLSAKSFESDLGNAGYQLNAQLIEPYDE